MTLLLKIISVFLLLINGIGALYGGSLLLQAPDGTRLKMPLNLLESSPFSDFFIPGLILFVVNGISSLLVVLATISGYKNYALLIIAQGAILLGWIGVQVLMLQFYFYLQPVMGAVGLLLLIAGWYLAIHETDRRQKLSADTLV